MRTRGPTRPMPDDLREALNDYFSETPHFEPPAGNAERWYIEGWQRARRDVAKLAEQALAAEPTESRLDLVRRYVASNLDVWAEDGTVATLITRDWLTKVLNVIDTGNPLLSKSEEQERGGLWSRNTATSAERALLDTEEQDKGHDGPIHEEHVP